MIGWMSRKESLGASYLRDSVKQSYVVVPCEDDKGKKGFDTIQVLKSSTKVIPKLKNNKLSFTAEVDVTGSLLESDCAQDLYKPGVIQSLEQGGGPEVSSLLQEAWKKGQLLNVDIFGAAEKTHRKYPKLWKVWSKNWDEVFKQSPLESKVKFRMARMGLSNKSFDYIMEKKEVMYYVAIVAVLAYIVLLIIGGKPLIRKKWYKDFVVYLVLLTWSAVIAVGFILDWSGAETGTTVALINMGMKPIRTIMVSIIGWGMN